MKHSVHQNATVAVHYLRKNNCSVDNAVGYTLASLFIPGYGFAKVFVFITTFCVFNVIKNCFS
jgi:hypothetical protein